jgi:hypothetical protein
MQRNAGQPYAVSDVPPLSAEIVGRLDLARSRIVASSRSSGPPIGLRTGCPSAPPTVRRRTKPA